MSQAKIDKFICSYCDGSDEFHFFFPGVRVTPNDPSYENVCDTCFENYTGKSILDLYYYYKNMGFSMELIHSEMYMRYLEGKHSVEDYKKCHK
jgi:hypothetical protein